MLRGGRFSFNVLRRRPFPRCTTVFFFFLLLSSSFNLVFWIARLTGGIARNGISASPTTNFTRLQLFSHVALSPIDFTPFLRSLFNTLLRSAIPTTDSKAKASTST
jgi:hypothetical protein